MQDRVPGDHTNGKDICAIAVTYHPDAEFPARINRILRQVGALLIVDNGSGEAEIRMLRDLSGNPLITLVWNSDNLGVASALNIGIAHAVRRGFRWVLLLDQDSCVNDDMVDELLAVQRAFPQRAELAVIGSGFLDVNKESPSKSRDARTDPWEEVEYVITSGSLIPLSIHAVVGPFREEFFIDYVDLDYCLRARAKGFRVIKTRRPLMSHAIGAYTRHSWLWMNKWTTNHSPDRRYYIARNDTVMLREYGNYVLGLWAWKSFVRCFRLCKRIVLYEQMKASKIIAVGQGWWDGIRGRMGPREYRRSRAK
jgi:rhamnosyltransferase